MVFMANKTNLRIEYDKFNFINLNYLVILKVLMHVIHFFAQ